MRFTVSGGAIALLAAVQYVAAVCAPGQMGTSLFFHLLTEIAPDNVYGVAVGRTYVRSPDIASETMALTSPVFTV